MNFQPNSKGYYGKFGGAFIPEMLHANIYELQQNYLNIIDSDDFKKEFDELLKNYVGRPTPLYFAKNLSAVKGAKIYLKREDLCHTGAHKLNNVIGQILLAKRLNKIHIIAETGAGQHGVATATVCALMGLKCTVFMGAKDIQRQQPNVLRMKMLGATVVPAYSGSQTLKDATNEAIRFWINNAHDTHYVIGSTIGPHPYPDMVAKFQSVISREIQYQLKEKEGVESPNYIVACVGGGSNAAGAFYHFIENSKVKLIGVEAAGEGIETQKTAATISTGSEGIIHGCKTLLMQNEDGQILEAHSLSAGLDYPGVGPLHAHLYTTGRAKYHFATDSEALKAAFELAKTEGIIPALESSHALAALSKLNFMQSDIIVVNLSGRGDKDLNTFNEYYEQQYGKE
ncbi:MAG: tryptophan synthase subunit beta [Tenuifilum sp.]|uniref:tryptophan synthase subunit beta n=1 Tax=Tenuifilum sp. TaxID=2760880 RepID=UPI0030A2E9DB